MASKIRRKHSFYFGNHSLFSSMHWKIHKTFLRRKVQSIEILVGTNQIGSGGKRYSVKYAIPHENYNNPEFAHDIAVIRLQTPIEFNEKVQPIHFSMIPVPANTDLEVFGLGRLMASISFLYLRKMPFEFAIVIIRRKMDQGQTICKSWMFSRFPRKSAQI